MTNAFICGGEPAPRDLAIVHTFAAALAQPTPHLTNLALIEQMAEAGEQDALDALAHHTLDPEPWSVGDPRDGRALRSTSEATGPVEWCDFDPREPHCQHRECYL
jgi:hypothetical protein